MKRSVIKSFASFLGFVFFVSGCSKDGLSKSSLPGVKVDSVYVWLDNMQHANGLLLSSEGGRYVSTYDNALAALTFISYGDFDKAEKIFNFFEGKLEEEFFQHPGGFAQMRTIDGVPVENRPHRWLGDNAWLLIALNNYHHLANNQKYQKLTDALTNWILSLQDSDGGLWGGYDANGKKISKIAEGNMDAFNAIPGYTAFHQKLLAHFKTVRWDRRDKLLIAWVENPRYKYALDLHSWGYCLFEDYPLAILNKANRFLTTQTSTKTQKQITGYCFDEDRDAVWFEGTGQMAVAWTKAKKERKARKYLQEMEKNLIPSPGFAGAYALPYVSNPGTSYGGEELWSGADTNPAVAATVWYLFGMLRFDPLELGYSKQIPEADKFWRK